MAILRDCHGRSLAAETHMVKTKDAGLGLGVWASVSTPNFQISVDKFRNFRRLPPYWPFSHIFFRRSSKIYGILPIFLLFFAHFFLENSAENSVERAKS